MTAIRKRILKAARGRFTPRQVSARIRGYLRGDRPCPWRNDFLIPDCRAYGGAICKAALPTLPSCGNVKKCPCMVYSPEYIIKRAGEALK